MTDHAKLEAAAQALIRAWDSTAAPYLDPKKIDALRDAIEAEPKRKPYTAPAIVKTEPAQDSAPGDEESHYENAQKICWCVRCSGDKEMHDVCNQQQIQRALDRVDRDGRKRTRFGRREAHADCRAEMVAEVTELLAGAAPMTWVGHRDMGGAHAWEIRAGALLTKLSEADHG